jgi:integrase
VTFRRPGRPSYYIKIRLPGLGVLGPLSTGTSNKATATGMETMLRQLWLSHPDLVRAVHEGRLSVSELYVSSIEQKRFRGSDGKQAPLEQLRENVSDQLITTAVDAYKLIATDARVKDGLEQLKALAPKGARISWLDPKNIVKICADAIAQGRTAGAVRRSLYRAISEILSHELGVQRKTSILAQIPKGKRPKQQPARDVRLTTAEIAAAIDACDAEFRPLVLAALLTGVDQGPLLEQRARDFNDERGTIKVIDTKAPDRMRTLELGDDAWQLYRIQAAGKNPGDRLFEFTRWQVRKRWDAVREAAKIPHVRFKDLRHVMATALEDAGAAVKAILGHSDPSTTLIYLGSQQQSSRELMNMAAAQMKLTRFGIKSA